MVKVEKMGGERQFEMMTNWIVIKRRKTRTDKVRSRNKRGSGKGRGRGRSSWGQEPTPSHRKTGEGSR